MKEFFSEHLKELFNWLCNEWLPKGPIVCFLEGFSGVGKSFLVKEVMRAAEDAGWKTAKVDAPKSEITFTDDLLLDLAQELFIKGYPVLVNAIDQGIGLLVTLEQLLQQTQVLVLIDNFQLALNEHNGYPRPELLRLIQHLGRLVQAGRLLLITNRSVERERWLEAHEHRHLDAFTQDEAIIFLIERLTHLGKPQAVPI